MAAAHRQKSLPQAVRARVQRILRRPLQRIFDFRAVKNRFSDTLFAFANDNLHRLFDTQTKLFTARLCVDGQTGQCLSALRQQAGTGLFELLFHSKPSFLRVIDSAYV